MLKKLIFSISSHSGLRALCILLRRLAYPNRLHDLRKMFGGNICEISRTINFMLSHIFLKFKHLVETVDHEWVDLESFAEVRKLILIINNYIVLVIFMTCRYYEVLIALFQMQWDLLMEL